MPSALTAKSRKVWRPGFSVALKGERQDLNGFLSSLQRKLPGWSEEKVNFEKRL